MSLRRQWATCLQYGWHIARKFEEFNVDIQVGLDILADTDGDIDLMYVEFDRIVVPIVKDPIKKPHTYIPQQRIKRKRIKP
jgi:hypothetical protein